MNICFNNFEGNIHAHVRIHEYVQEGKAFLQELVLFVIDNINISGRRFYLFRHEVAQKLLPKSGNDIVYLMLSKITIKKIHI